MLFVLFVGLEVVLLLLYSCPPSGHVWHYAVQQYYLDFEREVLQYDPLCTRYDAEVTYTLKPGRCNFRSKEFSTEIKINSAGFRSREEALTKPRLVVLGDSFAMGWGVSEGQTFADQMGTSTGLTTLNTAVSSYGTARELIVLKRVDMTQARYLIIQFCDNDERENREFLGNQGHLPIAAESEYQHAAKLSRIGKSYYPGKMTLHLLPYLRSAYQQRQYLETAFIDPAQAREMAQNFVDTLLLSPVKLDDLQLVVFQLNGRFRNSPGFAKALQIIRDSGRYPKFVSDMIIIDTTEFLAESDYYYFDDHLNERGHKKLADVLIARLGLEHRRTVNSAARDCRSPDLASKPGNFGMRSRWNNPSSSHLFDISRL